jgi:transaldolase
MNNLLNLINNGQSYWLDNLTREKIYNGELKRRVEKEGLRGVTTNPSIFNKAISTSSYYDNQITELIKQGKNINEVYEELTVKDVQDACDILKPIYDKSEGVDGFVSLEVSPHLAYNTNGTMIEARKLFKKLNRVNCFIKIPASKEGIPAIEEMLYEGININVTLIFSIEKYRAVVGAFINALERRANENKSVKRVRSVASFFISRIDTAIDNRLSKLKSEDNNVKKINPKDLLGRVAIANAKLAYSEFNDIFCDGRWNELKSRGAFVQRPLWASTGNKNPLYSDVKYVEELIGSNTVNTLPDATISAFADHGIIVKDAILRNLTEAEQTISNLKKLDIDLNTITENLLFEGIEKFKEDYDKLLNNLSVKRNKIPAELNSTERNI